MSSRKSAAHALAVAMLTGALSTEALFRRSVILIGPIRHYRVLSRKSQSSRRRPKWLWSLAKAIVAHFGSGTRPARERLVEFILNDPGFTKAYERKPLEIVSLPASRPRMRPATGAARKWNVPRVATVGELAQWLNLTPNELGWFADCRMQERKTPVMPLRHYHYRWRLKQDGSPRLIESPKQRLKAIQRYLLQQIINRIPPHEAVHGFRLGHSIRSFVAPHVGKPLVIRLDLKNFFPRISQSRILAIFLTAGYPEAVAKLLAGLCTNSTPNGVLKECPATAMKEPLRAMKLLYQWPHLPQGAPTSPALANLAAFNLDCRLAGLAKAVGASYTRYADDLVFSGDAQLARMSERFHIRVGAIALEEGFEVHTRKTRVMRQSVSQRAAGVVLNLRANAPRPYYEQLKAIIHNCVKHGPAAQNREAVRDFRAHLAGRIAHVAMLNPTRGKKLQNQFDQIIWPQGVSKNL